MAHQVKPQRAKAKAEIDNLLVRCVQNKIDGFLNYADSKNELATTHAKLKWITPRIVEMVANQTYGKQGFYRETTFFFPVGPS